MGSREAPITATPVNETVHGWSSPAGWVASRAAAALPKPVRVQRTGDQWCHQPGRFRRPDC